MESKIWKIGCGVFLLGIITVIFALIIPEQWDFIDALLEQWNPADVSMGFAMAISGPNTDSRSLRGFFSGRVNRNLSDNDFELLHDNFSKTESWQNFFQKIPEKKLNLLPERNTNDIRLRGVVVDLLLVPSITGWKIDGLKSVRENQEN